MHFELYNDAILLSDKIVNSANNFPEVLLQTFILRELNFEILENFKEASKELDKAEKLYYRGQDKPPSLKTRALPFIKRKQHKGDKQ